MNDDGAPVTARIDSPTRLLPDVGPAVEALVAATRNCGASDELLALIHLRVSQMNGCSACVDGAAHAAKALGTSEEKLFTVVAWRDAPWFSAPERAVLALTEAVTHIGDHPHSVASDVWDRAAAHFEEPGMAAILTMIATANLLNRLNLPTRQQAGPWDR